MAQGTPFRKRSGGSATALLATGLRRTGVSGAGSLGRANVLGVLFVEQGGELLHHRATELVGVDDGDGTAIVARDIVADADRDQLDGGSRFDPVDDVAQVALEIVAGIDRQG